ncbi:DNA polymerase III subunit epsilon [Aliivibrio sp. 1S165]|uniref:3'-5' exonuclease n=1 Tax=unclassified Aliivibrio TaxID=2645654 RepID=UPI00080E3DBD|nr:MULTISPECIES: 3'-5' exonuclease [unclassified Aliivibrio]OCH17371.1 DNA polymerase III subunit epsilon [Aliivibrio sp. 1S165]OCH34365.1 DNA polymerase III subunit epsilon [Aliivibrio sp. 1S175]
MKALLTYFHPLEGIKRKRKKYINTVNLPKMLRCLVEEPCPEIHDLAKNSNYIVLDLETTGLDSESDLILSMGWVDVINNKIDLASAQHLYLTNDSQIKPETAIINHITPQMLEKGASIHDAMATFFEAAKGKVIVAHACVMERNFINHYLFQTYGLRELPLLWLDTLCIEKKLANAISNHEDIDLTLSVTRSRYGLPEYNAHNALADAVSTAELLLAQQKRVTPNSNVSIGLMYKLSM